MVEQGSSKRQVAYKVGIADILNNRYVKEDGWLPNYIAVGGLKVSRANVVGVIVSKGVAEDADSVSQDFLLDDGSGRVSLRFFDSASDVDVGDVVRVIGRPREFGSERYVVPEVIRKIDDPAWVEVHKLELALQRRSSPPEPETPGDSGLSVETEDLADSSSPASRMLELIRRFDSGSGAEYELLSDEFGKGADSFVQKLLEQGDIFEVKPGRYKLLE